MVMTMEKTEKIEEATLLGILCQLLNESPDKVNQISFIKRTTGELKTLEFDFQLASLIKGTGPTRNFGGKGLITVRDVQENKIKSFPVDSTLALRTWNGKNYVVGR